jgi:hypothetical protein
MCITIWTRKSNILIRQERVLHDNATEVLGAKSNIEKRAFMPHHNRERHLINPSNIAKLIYIETTVSLGKVVPVILTEHHAMEAYWGSGGIVPRILDLGTRKR